jgi:hypothetical protein
MGVAYAVMQVSPFYQFYESDCRGHTSSSLIAERSCPGQSAPTAAGTRLGGLCGSLGQSSYCASFHLDSTRDPTGRWEAICTRALRTTVLSETRHAAGLTLLRVLRRGLELGECLG